MSLVAGCYEVTRRFPREELYGMVSQMRRAAISVPSNLAEGHSRLIPSEYAHFVRISHGSLRELETLILLAVRIGILKEDDVTEIQTQVKRCGTMLLALHRSLQKKLANAT
jgi:four helix bundle protein